MKIKKYLGWTLLAIILGIPSFFLIKTATEIPLTILLITICGVAALITLIWLAVKWICDEG